MYKLDFTSILQLVGNIDGRMPLIIASAATYKNDFETQLHTCHVQYKIVKRNPLEIAIVFYSLSLIVYKAGRALVTFANFSSHRLVFACKSLI